MNSSALIQHGIFIRIVCSAGSYQGCNQCTFAAIASPRDEDGLPSPADHAGVHETPTGCGLSHMELDMRFKDVEDLFKIE